MTIVNNTLPSDQPSRAPSARAARPRQLDDVPMVSVVSLALWILCALIGGVGLLLKFPWPRLAADAEPAPVVAQRISVEVAPRADQQEAAATPTAVALDSPPPPPESNADLQSPALAEVATPSPAIAFARPVAGPSRVVDAMRASPARRPPAATTDNSGPAHSLRHLIFGQGEGRQPRPDYPREALIAGEQGSVVVRFTVNEDGKVIAAEPSSPCRWPLLNSSAASTVRDRWTFAPGPVRTFEVTIVYKIN